jgi:hypothetical protein
VGGSWCAGAARSAVAPSPQRSLMRRRGLDALVELLVALDLGAARRGELHEGEAPAELGVRARAARSTASSAPRCPSCSRGGRRRRRAARRARGRARRAHAPRHASTGGDVGQPAHRPLDRDGVRPHQGAPPPCTTALLLAVDAALHEASTASMKLLQCCWVWKPTMLEPSRPGDQLLAPRADADALGVGPGDVPERDDRRPRQPLADHLRREREVVVLHEDDGIVGVDLGAHRVGEARLTRRSAPSRRRGRPGARGRRGRAARAPRWRSRSSSRCSSSSVSQTRRTTYDSSPGGPHAVVGVDVSRSALPLPCATQTPEQARITGSSAVTSPLAGWSTSMASPRARGCRARGSRGSRPLALQVLRRVARSRSGSTARPGPRPRAPRIEPRRRARGRRARAAGTPAAPGRVSARRSSSVQRRHASRAASRVTTDGGEGEDEERAEHQPAGGRLAPLEEAQVVHQHDRAERPPSPPSR